MFKETYSFEKRKSEVEKLRIKYPDRIPVIVESSFPIDKKKYLVPTDLSVSQFIYVVRKRIKLPEEDAIFIFFNNTLPSGDTLMSQIEKEFVDSDGFVYALVTNEETFG